MKQCIKNKKGFTLVEMIISVAFLAVISLVLAELFISSQNCLDKAHDLDQSVHIAKKTIENFKAGEGPNDFIDESISSSDISESGDTIVVKTYYDEDWKILNPSDDLLQSRTAFVSTVEIKPALPGAGGFEGKGIYAIHVKIDKSTPYVMEKATAVEIYSLDTEKYFSRLADG